MRNCVPSGLCCRITEQYIRLSIFISLVGGVTVVGGHVDGGLQNRVQLFICFGGAQKFWRHSGVWLVLWLGRRLVTFPHAKSSNSSQHKRIVAHAAYHYGRPLRFCTRAARAHRSNPQWPRSIQSRDNWRLSGLCHAAVREPDV